MPCQYYSLEITQGTDYSINLGITDDNGNLLNLSGSSVDGYIKGSYGYTGTGLIFNLNPTFIYQTSGNLSLNISNEITSTIPIGIFPYYLSLTNPSGIIIEPLKGFAYISP